MRRNGASVNFLHARKPLTEDILIPASATNKVAVGSSAKAPFHLQHLLWLHRSGVRYVGQTRLVLLLTGNCRVFVRFVAGCAVFPVRMQKPALPQKLVIWFQV